LPCLQLYLFFCFLFFISQEQAPPADLIMTVPGNKRRKGGAGAGAVGGDSRGSTSATAGRSEKKNNNNKKKKPLPDPDSGPSSSDSSDGEDERERVQLRQLKKKKKQPKRQDDDDDDASSSESSEETDGGGGSSSDSDGDDDRQQPVFSDKNASWLKPKEKKKKQSSSSDLLSSSSEEDGDDGDGDNDDDDGDGDNDDDEQKRQRRKDRRGSSSDDDDEEGEELLDIEKEARLADEEEEAERYEAEEELRRTVRDHTSVYHLPTPEEIERDVDRVVPPSEIRSHVDSILEVLADFKQRREPGRARKEYVDQLGSYLAELYGYLPELVEYFLTMFGPAETVAFVEQSDSPRPLVIRTNTLKARRKDLAAALIKRGVSLDPLASWSKVGLKIVDSPVPIGATPEYLSGMYMLQSAASMCPVLALAPQLNERVLDVSAAPGGKTSYIAQLMRNTGVILANDIKAERQKATVANLHRLGVKNVVACQYDGRKLGSSFKNRFDRVLLDAPCSGLGVISRDPSVKVQRTIADVKQCAHLQKELLLAAIDSLKYKGTSGGVMVYSTCSVSVAENEEVVNYALSKRDIKIVDSGLDFGKPGFTRFQHKRFHPSMALTRRFYPHVHNMDGFFVAKIQKLSDKPPGTVPDMAAATEDNSAEKVTEEKDKEMKGSRDKKKDQIGGKDKKRKLDAADDDEDKAEEKKLSKGRNVSVPPKKQKQKKQRQSAKNTKPRRIREEA